MQAPSPWQGSDPWSGFSSLEKTLMLRKIEGKIRRQRQRMRWLDSITDPMDIIWANSRWWRTGKPCVLQSVGSQSPTWLSNWTTLEYNDNGNCNGIITCLISTGNHKLYGVRDCLPCLPVLSLSIEDHVFHIYSRVSIRICGKGGRGWNLALL